MFIMLSTTWLCSVLVLVLFSPFFPHLLDAWSKRHHSNLLFIFYEDLKKVTNLIDLRIIALRMVY